MARSIFALTAVVLALSFSAQAQAQDVGSMFCDYGLYMCPDMYGSSNVSCINYTLVCDGTVHCYGGRDESLCGNCSSGYIQCPNTDTCISNTQACDGVVDCTLDDADETVRACGCVNDNQVPVCERSMNDTTRYCLNETLVCDGISHCMYGEDESSQYCGQECEGDLLSCFDNGTCYEVYEMCNGAFECPNGFDEGNCSDSAADRFCPYATYNCPNLDGNGGRTCINYTRVCDGTNDCYNGTDEAFCGDCPMDSIACASNSSICVENTRTCDGIQDCPDGCDESITACGCSDSAQIPVCRDGNGNPYCVNRTALCDGMSDCMNGEDEQFPYCPTATTPPPTTNPPVSCPTGYVPCATFSNSGPPCINNSLVCNSFSDCADQSDEFYCNGCPTGELMCQGLNFTQCVANTYLCDGDNNCPNGFDESICTTDNIMPTGTPTGTPTFACPTGYVACATFSNSGSPCINNSLVCNSYIDCADQSDEFYCNDCPTDELMCQGLNFTQCVPNTYLCDGNNNCPNGFDESICTIDITTPTGMPTGPPIGGPCPNGSLPCGFNFSNCWVPEQACDGVNDCGDELAYDEIPGFVELSGESCITDGGSGSGFLGGTNDLVIGLLAPPFFDGLIPFSEFGGSFSFCIVRGGVSSSDEFNVTVTTTDVNAVAGYDYEDATQTLYFGSQDSIMCINVTIIEDDLIESTENFTISLSVSADVNYTFIGPTEATVVILDFNGVGFDLVTSNVTESDNATFELCITLTDIRGGLERNVTLEIRQIDFGLPTGAQNGVDFTITNPFITIPRTAENGTKMCFTFANVINDERIEDTERAIFFLTSNNFADVSRDTSFTIEIIDNDFVQFELLNATEVQVEEGRSISLCLAPVGNVSAYYDRLLPYITVIFNVTSETADNGDYYTGSVYQLFDVRSSDIVCVMIITREDSQIENTETLRVTAIISDPDVVVGPSQVRVYILDRDSAEFESSFMPYIAMREADWYLGAPPRSFCFSPTSSTRGYLQRDVTLTFTPRSLGAMKGEDFMINDTEVTFYYQGNMTEVCLELVIVNDLFIEDLERFTIEVVPNNLYDRILGNNRTEISIEDNDFAEFVSPFNAMIAMRESDWFPEKEPRSFCLVPTNRTRDYLRRSVAVTFTPSTLGAMMGEDFMLYGTMQTFYQDNTSVCLQLRIINDRRIEDTESFAIEISLDNTDDSILGVNRTEISIADDDYVVVELELVANNGYVSEGDTFNVNLVLVNVMDGLETDVEVNVTVGVNSRVVRRHVDVYASSNEFSPFGVQILTIPSSSMNRSVVSLTVTVVDDEIVENDEGLRISVNPGNQYQVTNEQAGTVVLTIMDNDGVSLFLSTNEIMSLEGGEISVTVYVDMSTVHNRDVQVNVTIDYNNADANDIGTFSQVLVFVPDINAITVTIPVVTDNIVGSDKTFTVNFTPTNSLDTFINGSNSVSVTIIESANLTLTQRNVMAMEGDVVEVCVAHAHTLEDSVSVLLTLMTGTAEEADFAFYGVPGPNYIVTFNIQTSNQMCVNVSLIDDDIAENSESFVVVLTAIDTDDTIGINNTTITIADNDGVVFSSPNVVATETDDNQDVLVCVTMTPPTGGLDRNAAVSDGESGVTLTFSPTDVEETQCVNVTVFGDDIVESNETMVVTFHIQYPQDSMNGSLYFSANIIIVDDDGATVSFTIPSQDANEDAGNVSVCVTLVDVDGGLSRAVPYTITSDMRNIWYDEFPGNSSAGQEKCITVYIEEDQIVEDPEIRVFTLAVVNGNDLLGDIVTHNVTEIDNDGVSITLMPIGEVMENQTVIEFFVEGILDKDITVTVYIVEDTNDTMIIDGDLIVSDNGTYTVVLVVIGDSIIENPETYTVQIRSDNTFDEIGPAQDFTIIDQDGATIQLDLISDITETDEDVNITVSFSVMGVFERPSIVTVGLVPADTNDVRIVNNVITVAESGGYTVTMVIVGDVLIENTEDFRLMFVSDNDNDVFYQGLGPEMIEDGNLSFSVMDNDDAIFTLATISDVTETDVDITIPVNFTVTGLFERNSTVTVRLALDTNDVIIANGEVTVSVAGDYYVELVVVGDEIVESDETFTVEIAVSNPLDTPGPTQTFTVSDDDGAVITLMAIGNVMEDQTVDVMFSVEGTLEKNITVTVSIIGGDTNDAMIMDGVVIVSASGTYTVVLVVIGDAIIENPETYTVQISSDNTFDEIGPAQDFTIIDQDGAMITLIPIDVITETNEDVNITVSFSVMGTFERPSIVTVSLTQSGVSESDINDVKIVYDDINVAQSGEYTVTMVIVGDVLIENTEQFQLVFVSDNDNDVFYQGLGPEMIENGSLSFSVMDNDGAIFTLGEFEVAEETDVDITIPVNFAVAGQFERMSTVTVKLALDTSDVMITNGEVTVSVAGDYSVNLVVVGDQFVEGNETFTVEIVVSNPLDISGPSQILTVSDDDGAIVLLETTMVDLAKGDAVRNTTQVCLSVTSDLGLLERDVTISTSVDESGLTVDSELAITMETGRVCFEVSVIDDGEVLNSVLSFQITFSLRWTVDNFEQFFITTIYVTPLVTDVNYTPFIDLAEDDGVKLQSLTNTDDGCSSLIYINSGLPYGSRSETSLRVCANGAISIGTEHFNFFSPSRFPSSSSQISSSNVLAPYWNDHDLRGDGSSINYKVYTREQGSRVSDAKLDAISRLISNKEELSFSGIWMLVAEWNGAPAYPFNTDNPPRNTYQAVVVTDGTQTFAVYTYNCEQLEWESGQGSSVYSVIGYNTNDGNSLFSSVNPFMNHPLSRSKGVQSVACVNNPLRVEWANLVYLVGNDTGAGQLARADCINRANKDQSSFQAKSFNSRPCPCSLAQARRDNRYRFASSTLFSITRDTSFFDNFCYVQRFTSTSGVQLCCYSRQFFDFGALLGDRTSDSGVSSSLLRYNPFSQRSNYLEFDYKFQQSCCENSDMCQEYTRLRPSDYCSSYRPQRRAWCWGDPHITTLDGGVFTFNGWGEYSLLELTTDTTNFTLQGRTSNVSASEGSATKLIAFAFGMSTEMRVQVDVNGDTGLTVLFNGNDISANVSNTNDSFMTDQLSVSRDSERALTTSFENGIGVTVTASFGMLSFVLVVPEEFRNITRGLMGNYNGERMDDVVFRNGTMLAANVSDRTIHEVGQSWEISPLDSFFTYPVGMSAADYSFPNHEPIFADEAADSVPQDVIDACGDNQECIFDAIQTGNLEIGMETLTTNNGNIDDQNQASNSPPLITGPNMLRLDVGVMAILRFNVSDDKNMFTITVVGGLPENSQLTPTVMDGYTDYEFNWTLSTVESARSIMFEARDELNASAILNVQVQTCACRNSSDCTIEGIADTTASSIVLNCECSEAWMGEFCEEDVDGCMEFMCFDDVACTDVPAPGVGAACGMCPDGYVGDGEKCEDINECTNGTHGCSQICNNVQGSFECLCNEGYRLANATYCEDINECDVLNGRCHQECANNNGGRSCSCLEGYKLSSDNLTCTVLPMAMCPVNNTCSQNCVSLLGVETCSCNQGYQLATNNQTCSDVDECLEDPCGQGCNNTDGGFLCYCRDGYTLQPDETTCMDINECLVSAMSGVTLCTSPMFCVNMPGDAGKYSCQCPEGTIQNGNTCVMPTTPPPTIVVPTGTVPSAFRDNAVVITLADQTAEEFDETQRQMFRVSTANAINAYCRENPCTFSRKRQAATVTADDVIIENVRDNNAGHLTFDMYVQSGGSAALPASAVQEAIEENPNFFPGQMVMVEPLEAPPTTMLPIPVGLSTAEIIGIAVGCAVGGILLIVLIVVLIVCIIRYRHKHQKSVNFSYGIEYDNPVADNDDDIEPANTRPMNGVEITVAAPDIYVNPGDLSEQAEEEPKAKEAAVTDEIAERDEGASNSDRSMQSLILKFGDDDDNASQHSTEKEELTSL